MKIPIEKPPQKRDLISSIRSPTISRKWQQKREQKLPVGRLFTRYAMC